MKSKYWMAAGLLLCASTAADAGPRPLVNALIGSGTAVLNPLLRPFLSVSGPIFGSFVPASGPVFVFVGGLATRPVRTLLAPIGAGARLPGLR